MSRVALLSFAALALACTDEVRAPLDLDAIEQPSETCLKVVHESLELGPQVHAIHRYLADAPGSIGGWALVSQEELAGGEQLALIRIPSSPDEPELEPLKLGYSNITSLHVDMRNGTAPGELWLLIDSKTSAILRKFAPGVGGVVGNGSIANFPAATGGSCSSTFARQLLLIEGRPFILALPACSTTTALDLQLLELDPNTVLFNSSWILSFNPCASDPECATHPYTIDPIRGGESTRSANAERIAVGFSQVREFSDGTTSSDVSLLELRLSAGAPAARLVTFRQVWVTPTSLDPVHLAQDPFSVQLHVRNGGSEQDAALLRFDAIGELYVQIKAPQLLPMQGRGRLVQLDTQSALVDVRDTSLEVVPLVDVETWPVWDSRIVYELDGLVGVEPAGVGQLLLRRDEAPPQVVQLRCLD